MLPASANGTTRNARPTEIDAIAFNAAMRPAYERCPNCAIRLPARRYLRDFTADVLAERARLAMVDPAGEQDAVRPLDGVKARQVLLHLQEPQPRPYRPAPQPGTPLDETAILERLGCDTARGSGMIRCPAHEDRGPSLSWKITPDGRALLHCFRGCTWDEIRAAL